MADTVLCNHGHPVNVKDAETLPDSQAFPGRHKCVACAIDLGRVQGIEAIAVHIQESYQYYGMCKAAAEAMVRRLRTFR